MNTKEKGDIVVGDAIGYFTRKNIQVCLPLGDKQPYDIVIQMSDGYLKKVQCKYAGQKYSRMNDHVFIASVRITGGNQSRYSAKNYQKGDFDFLYTLTPENVRYLIPADIILTLKSTITLYEKYNEFILLYNHNLIPAISIIGDYICLIHRKG